METWHFVWMAAALTGLSVAGIVGDGWAMVTGERPHLRILSTYSIMTPLRLAALIAYAPLVLVRTGLAYLDQNLFLAALIFGIGLAWSFMHGVFIMVTFFGFS